MEARKRRRTLTIVGACLAIFSLFFFLQVESMRDQLDMAQASLYRLLGILSIVTGSVFVLLGSLKGHHEHHTE